MYLQKFTGIFDENTRQAVIAFQKSCRLLPDGIVGKNTLVQLDKVSVGAGKSYFLVGDPLRGDPNQSDGVENCVTSPGVKDAVTYDPDYQTNKWVNVFYNLK